MKHLFHFNRRTNSYLIATTIITITLASCNSGKSKQPETQTTPTAKTEIKERKEEVFEDFFEQFCKDSIFKNSRIESPLTFFVDRSINDELDTIFTIEPKDFGYVNFKAKFTNSQEEMSWKISELKPDSAIVNWYGVECGINYKLQFVREENGWYMKKISDFSH